MVEWRPGEPVPVQLGDAFAALYDWFKPRHATDADNEAWGDAIPSNSQYSRLKGFVERASEATPEAIQRYIDKEWSERREMGAARAVYYSLLAIDRGIKRQMPLESDGTSLGASLGLVRHYFRYFRFNTDVTDGYVLPKWTCHPYRGGSSIFEDNFENLVRAPVDRNYVRLLGRAGSRSRRRRRGDVDNPGIVIVPTLYEFSSDGLVTGEASFVGVELRGNSYFKLEHNSSALASLGKRVEESVRAIHESGATIAVYPELVLNQELLDTLRKSLLAESRNYRESRLDWVVAGAGIPTGYGAKWPVSNCCYVLNSYGQVLSLQHESKEPWTWTQEKRYRYKLTASEQERYGITGCFSNHVDREEAITRGKFFYVFEDRGRRFAVIICEDLAQEEDTVEIARKMLCSVVITIVMDGPVRRRRWHGQRSSEFATRTGALTVVANSLLLPNLRKVREEEVADKREEGKDSYPSGEKPVGLMFIPTDGGEPGGEEIRARATPVPDDRKTLVSGVHQIPLLRLWQ